MKLKHTIISLSLTILSLAACSPKISRAVISETDTVIVRRPVSIPIPADTATLRLRLTDIANTDTPQIKSLEISQGRKIRLALSLDSASALTVRAYTPSDSIVTYENYMKIKEKTISETVEEKKKPAPWLHAIPLLLSLAAIAICLILTLYKKR